MAGRNVAMQTSPLPTGLRRPASVEKQSVFSAHCQPRAAKFVSPGCLILPVRPFRPQFDQTDVEKRSVAIMAATAAAAPAAAACAPGSQLLIAFAFAYAAPFFGMMLFAPQWEKTQEIMQSLAIFIPLALVYVYLLAMSWQPDTISLMMPGNVKEGFSGFNPQFFPKLEAISTLFSRLTTAVSVWIHILTINLFVARFYYLKGLASKIPTFHTVLIAVFFGPLAILSAPITQSIFGGTKSETSSESLQPQDSGSSSTPAGRINVEVDLPNGAQPNPSNPQSSRITPQSSEASGANSAVPVASAKVEESPGPSSVVDVAEETVKSKVNEAVDQKEKNAAEKSSEPVPGKSFEKDGSVVIEDEGGKIILEPYIPSSG